MLLAVTLGALPTQIFILHGDVIHVFILLAATLFLTWTAWRRSRAA